MACIPKICTPINEKQKANKEKDNPMFLKNEQKELNGHVTEDSIEVTDKHLKRGLT